MVHDYLCGRYAYSQMVYEKLAPALQYVWWIDSKNFVEFTRPLYAKLLPFPLNFYYPGQYEKRAKQMMASLFGEDDDSNMIETAVSDLLISCLYSECLIMSLARRSISKQKNASHC